MQSLIKNQLTNLSFEEVQCFSEKHDLKMNQVEMEIFHQLLCHNSNEILEEGSLALNTVFLNKIAPPVTISRFNEFITLFKRNIVFKRGGGLKS